MSPRQRLLTHDIRPLVAAGHVVSGLSRLYHNSLVRIGESHLSHDRNCQDYAISAECAEGTVLVVTDGASTYHDDFGHRVPSFNEAGAVFVAEVARAAALEGLQARLTPDAIRDLVGVQLHGALRPIWRALGELRGKRVLGCTLLLALVTEAWTRIYLSGDGAWGAYLPSDSLGAESLTGRGLIVRVERDLIAARGSLHTPELGRLASTAARLSPEAVSQALAPVLAVDAPVLGAWVATDGLRDEPKLQALVYSRPPHSSASLLATLERPKYSDDVAIAWASDRLESILLAQDPPSADPNGLDPGGAHA